MVKGVSVTPPSFRVNNFRAGQVPDAVWDLIDHCRSTDQLPPLGEHTLLQFRQGHPENVVGFSITEEPQNMGGNPTQAVKPLAAAGFVPTVNPSIWGVELVVHSDFRTEQVLSYTLEQAVQHLRQIHKITGIRTWTRLPTIFGYLQQQGFVPEREILQLLIKLPQPDPVFPTNITVQGFRKGLDEEVWLKLNNQAFVGHPENGGWNEETLLVRTSQSWFDPEGLRMAWENGRLAGFCWTKLHSQQVGEIYIIAVAKEAQGQGLGKAMVREGLSYLYTINGATTGMLYVDRDNLAATNMYQSLGFKHDHSIHVLQLHL